MTEKLGEELMAALCVLRMQRLAQGPTGSIETDILSGLVDPIRVFVKNELHSRSKARDKRWRIISSVSVVDQMVERVLCGKLNNFQIENYASLPMRPGMGNHDEGLLITEQAINKMERPVGTDLSSFDWTVPYWLLKAELAVRKKQMEHDFFASAVADARLEALALARFITSDGFCYDQVEKGVQKSGSYNTSCGNSRMRVLIMSVLGWWGIAMGDDAVESLPDGLPVAGLPGLYASLGFKLKDAHEGPGLEFCAYRYLGSGRFEFARSLKVVGNALCKRIQNAVQMAETEASLLHDLRHRAAGDPDPAGVMELLQSWFGQDKTTPHSL